MNAARLVQPSRVNTGVERRRVRRLERVLDGKRARVLTLALLLFVVFICHTSSYNMAQIIWWSLSVVNWPLSEISKPGVLQNEAYQWLTVDGIQIEARCAAKFACWQGQGLGPGCAMTGLRH
jgi:hypothetical protein